MFLRHMNRALVGTMLEVGAGRRALEDFTGLLDGSPRPQAGRTAPAHGLALARVSYGERARRGLPERVTTPSPSRTGAAPMLDGERDAERAADQRRRDRGRGPSGDEARAGRARGRAAGGDRARRQPLGDGPLDHDAQAAVGGRGALLRRHGRLRDRRHAGRLREAREPRGGRGLRDRPGGRGDQPRREPRRRHHLLGHGGRGARGGGAGPAGDRRLPAVGGAGARLSLRRRLRLRRGGRRSSRGWWSASRRCRCRPGRCST